MFKRLYSSVPAYIALVFKITGLYLFIFFCCRLLFCFFNLPESNDEPVLDYLQAFYMGLRFDLLIISFILMLPALLLFIHNSFLKENKVLVTSIKIYLLVISIPVFFITCADIPYFSQFGSHINKSVTVWKMSPGYALELIFSSFHYWGFSLVFLVAFILYYIGLRKFFSSYFLNKQQQDLSLVKKLLFLLLLAFLLFAGARGRLSSKSTMHEGMAIVSPNAFVNQIALNANFTLIKSLSRKAENKDYLKNIEHDLKVCAGFYDQNYFPKDGISNLPIVSKTPGDSINRFNVIVVLMESFNMSKMGYYKNKNLSPYLTSLTKESVFFDRFFSSGIHTFNGLFSTNTGFPSIYTEQGLRECTKQPFTTLANLLKPYGYHSYFCTTHDPVFDNMQGFFTLNGYDKYINDSDFKLSESIGVTGVPDHLLFKKLVETITSEEKDNPFVAFVMTGTDHGPWHIPNNIDFKPTGSSYQENASMYADWSVKQFMEEAKKQSWYKNTVFVFLGDHGQIMNDPYDMPITYHHTPLIIHCPQLLEPSVNHHLGYQPDVVKTVTSLLEIDYNNFSFGENILEKSRPLVFFSADDKLGYITEDDWFFYHTFSDNQKRMVKYKEFNAENFYEKNKHRADSLYGITKSLYNSAQYYIHQNYRTN